MTRGEAPPRRVCVITSGAEVPQPRPEPTVEDGPADERRELLGLLEELAERVRDGRLDAERHDGVLLDTVVGGVRCLLLDQTPSLLVELSPREQQVAIMVAHGRTNQAIASALEISVWTVSSHLRRIFAKLAVSSRAEMVAHLLAQADFAATLGHPPD